MSHKLTILAAFAIGAASGVIAGCQTYDFEPVEPLAIAQTSKTTAIAGRRAKPNMMLLVDKSGSMNEPINPSASACIVSGNACGPAPKAPCPTSCPTRWSELRNAMGSFLTTYGTVGRMGLQFYPKGTFCDAPALTDIKVQIPNSDDDAAMQAAANAIRDAVIAEQPVGGTPTGNSLLALSNYPPLLDTSTADRGQYIVVLTDGLPNCNQNNANDYTVNQAACRCTLAGGVCQNQTGCPGCNKLGCLDKDNSVQQVKSLQSRGINTIVIGFGAELTGSDGFEVLNAMAAEGGFARKCDDDADCGGSAGSCETAAGTCKQKFYQASNGDELGKALTEIQKIIGVDPCVFKLDATPSDPSLLSVIVDGTNTPSTPETWAYEVVDGQPQVKFQGKLCLDLQNATVSKPINVEFRVVESL